jgi:hypothetical protein
MLLQKQANTGSMGFLISLFVAILPALFLAVISRSLHQLILFLLAPKALRPQKLKTAILL